MFTHNCEKKGHKLEARYDLTMPTHMSETMLDEVMCLVRDVSELKDKVYVRDICTKCGFTVSRNDSSSPNVITESEEE
jgi:hypothetical protein